MNNELKWGMIGSVLIFILTFFYISQYQNQNKKIQSSQIYTNNSQISQPASVTLTLDEVAKHNQPQDCWIIINNQVYGVSEYLALHPGGAGEITPYCGQDATQAYNTKGGRGNTHSQTANQELGFFSLGTVNSQVNLPNSSAQKQNINKLKQLPVNRRDDD